MLLFIASLRGGILSFILSRHFASSKPLILCVGENPLSAVNKKTNIKLKTINQILYIKHPFTDIDWGVLKLHLCGPQKSIFQWLFCTRHVLPGSTWLYQCFKQVYGVRIDQWKLDRKLKSTNYFTAHQQELLWCSLWSCYQYLWLQHDSITKHCLHFIVWWSSIFNVWGLSPE